MKEEFERTIIDKIWLKTREFAIREEAIGAADGKMARIRQIDRKPMPSLQRSRFRTKIRTQEIWIHLLAVKRPWGRNEVSESNRTESPQTQPNSLKRNQILYKYRAEKVLCILLCSHATVPRSPVHYVDFNKWVSFTFCGLNPHRLTLSFVPTRTTKTPSLLSNPRTKT